MIHLKSVTDLQKWCQGWVGELRPKTIVLLDGPVGAGKTQLVLASALALGAQPSELASPSYGIIHGYDIAEKFGVERLWHVDLYRLNDEDDLESSGFWDLFSEKDSVVFVEWAERLNFQSLPKTWRKLQIKIGIEAEFERSLRLEEVK